MATKCPKCQTENPDTSQFCADCGTRIRGHVPDSPESGTSPQNSKDIRSEVTETLQTPINELTTGSTFAGRYQIIEELGRGGMGRVYRVLDKKLNEEVALKLIKPEIASDKRTLERFSNELKIARKIVNKNVGRMYHLSEEQGTYYITMEYVPGENLKSSIRRFGPLPIGKTIFLAVQICEGLSEAHQLGVVHRDLKPGNIMIDEEGNARIMDFGIARSLKERGITGEGVIIGTPEYMSPEQVEGKDVDQKSDIYSLGVILYEMVTGRVPFSGDTPLSVAVKQKTEAPPDPRRLNAQVPENLSQVILKCLEKIKEKRYQSAEELHSELSRLEEEIPTTERAIPKRKLTKSKEIAAREGKAKWKKVGLYGGAVILLALIVYAGFRLFTGGQEAIDSIAVLPFENVNADPNNDYLCDGITETIINKLSQLSNLKKVIARNSVFTYKGKTVDPKKVGQELGVKAVLLTRLVRVGDMLTVSPTLVRTKDNSQLWGERYNRTFDDVFAIEEEMATSVIQALRLKLSGEERQKIFERPINNAAAYEYYLKANQEIFRFSEDALDRALRYIQEGLDMIGDNALLYSAQAYIYWQYVNIGIKQEDYIAKAEECVNKALALDPDFPKAHDVLGNIYRDFRGNPQDAVRHFKRALAGSPNEPSTLFMLAWTYLSDIGKPSGALVLIERFKQVDPLNPLSYFLQGGLHLYSGQYKLALEPLRKIYQLDPQNAAARSFYAMTLAYNNELDQAFSVIAQDAKAAPDSVPAKFGLMLKYGLLKDKERAFKEMTPDFKKTCQRDPEWSYILAARIALLGAKKDALDWLENAVDRGFINYPLLAEKDPFLANLRGEERFKKLMERVKYEWEHFEE